MKILFLTHYYPPEVNAPATRTFEHCVRWARAGHDVTVVTCAPNCPGGVVFEGYKNRLRWQVEMVDGVRVVRVWTYVAKNSGTFRRIANYLSYMFSAILACWRLPRPDVVIATSPQFFCGWAGVLVSKLKRIPFVLEIRDIWPESIEAVGAMKNRRLIRFLEFLERRMYKAADSIVAVGKGYRDNILQKVDVENQISVILEVHLVTKISEPRKLFVQRELLARHCKKLKRARSKFSSARSEPRTVYAGSKRGSTQAYKR
ncbi:MAG: glycosyltransferase family 4 protein [Planctomycetes bacterium]|nr:glycosyltransferase family 4 protein [Planctomycetota bacterium]